MWHEPVLAHTLLEYLPSSVNGSGMWMLDATFGRGGHTKAVLNRLPLLSVMAMDRDRSAIEYGMNFSKKIHLFHGNFSQFSSVVEKRFPGFIEREGFDIIVMDLGVSSPQLEDGKRGFSFYQDGPLDMRMDQTQDFSASDVVNAWSEEQLSDLFYECGNIRYGRRRVAKAIVKEREKRPIVRTKQLADVIEKQLGWRKKGVHPATAYFLALRLQVNQELENVQEALPKMIQALKPQGRLFVLSFHSLEDRLVKQAFREAKHLQSKEFMYLAKRGMRPSREEVKKNPRARSARLRIFTKAAITKQ